MTESEQIFWSRVLELTKSQLKQTTYELFVLDACLIQIEQNMATIYLGPMKELFWDKDLKPIVLTTGFEVCDAEIIVNYVFEEDLTNQTGAVVTSQAVPTTQKNTLPLVDSDLNTKYTFDNFVQDGENRWAFSASYAVADAPRTAYNPFSIWGESGLGEAHLLNAIGNTVLQNSPGARVKYITAESFINEFVIHIRLDTMEELKEKFRNLDVSLIDDIQSLAKKTLSGAQEESSNTFNALYDNNGQIVLTSDRTPDRLDNLEQRLATRFKWGLTINITPPDFEIRVVILMNKTQEYNYIFSQDTIEYLAGQFDSNVRDFEGALKGISLVTSIKKIETITVDVAVEAICARKQDGPKVTVIPIDEIQSQVGKFYGVTVKEIKATKRAQGIVLARQIAMYLAREMTDNPLPKIGREFGGRDHSTVLHAYSKIKNMSAQGDSLRIGIETIKNKIK